MKKIMAAVLAVVLALLLASCGEENGGTINSSEDYIYYLNSGGDALYPVPYEGDAETTEEMIGEFLALISGHPENKDYQGLLTDDVSITDYTLDGGELDLSFTEEYEEMDSIREVLVRAGVVRTLVQIDGVDEVRFLVNGKDAVSPDGKILGIMNADTFVEDSGRQINAVTHTEITLYFTDSTGTHLSREARSIYYSASKPLEWAIVERLIAGPKVEGNYATLPSNTQIISVTSSNGICYVNLNRTFVSGALNVSEEIPVYSIVNSILEDCRDIDAVQIAVEGDSNLIFRENMDLSRPFTANTDLVQ